MNRIWLAGALVGEPVLRFARDGSAETRLALWVAKRDQGGDEIAVLCRGSLATGIVDRIDPGDQALVEGSLAHGTGVGELVVVATRVERL